MFSSFGKINIKNLRHFAQENSVKDSLVSESTITCAPTKISIEIQEELIREILAQAFGCKPGDFTFGFKMIEGESIPAFKDGRQVAEWWTNDHIVFFAKLNKDNAEVSVKY